MKPPNGAERTAVTTTTQARTIKAHNAPMQDSCGASTVFSLLPCQPIFDRGGWVENLPLSLLQGDDRMEEKDRPQNPAPCQMQQVIHPNTCSNAALQRKE